jgi:hypothetical protein
MLGLPHSGTTSLLLKLLNRESKLRDSNGLDIYEAMIFKDSVSGKSKLHDLTDTEDKNDAMLLFSLAKFLVNKHYKITLSEEDLQKELCTANNFENHKVDAYFRDVCGKLFKMMKDIEESDEYKVGVTRSHGFVNFFDMNVNKAAYEVVTVLGSTVKHNVLLFSLLNLAHYTKERLKNPLDLTEDFYQGKYSGEELHMFDLHKGFEYVVHSIEGTFALQRDRPNALMIGTGASNKSGDHCGQIGVIDDYAQRIGIRNALSRASPMYLKKDDIKDYEAVKEEFFKMVDRDKEFEVYLPIRYIFLRCLLHSISKPFITRKELNTYAKACHMEKEVDAFLDIFSKCCSICVIPTKGDVDSFIVLQPSNALLGFEKLFKNRDSLSREDRDLLKDGLLSEKMAKRVWSVPDTCSESTGI